MRSTSHAAPGLSAGGEGQGPPPAESSPAGDGRPADAPQPSAGLVALCLVARLHHVAADPSHLAHQLGWSARHVACASDDLLLAARALGLKAKASRSSAERLELLPLPALAFVGDAAESSRVVVLAQCDGERVLLQEFADGQRGRPTIEPLVAFAARWTGELILIASRASLAGALARFDFSWFIRASSSTGDSSARCSSSRSFSSSSRSSARSSSRS